MVKRRNSKAKNSASSGGRNDLKIAAFFLAFGLVFVGFVVWKENNKKYANSLFGWGEIFDSKGPSRKVLGFEGRANVAEDKMINQPLKQVPVRYSDKDRQQLETILNK